MQACSRRCGTASTRSFAGVQQQQRAGRRQLHVVAVADITQAEFEQEVLKVSCMGSRQAGVGGDCGVQQVNAHVHAIQQAGGVC